MTSIYNAVIHGDILRTSCEFTIAVFLAVAWKAPTELIMPDYDYFQYEDNL